MLFASGLPEFVNAVFVLGILAAIAMILGWKTRAATILLWVILFSIQTRNAHLNSAADTLVRVTMFWAMLLPLGQVWSIDSYVRTPPAKRADQPDQSGQRSTVSSLASFGLVFQIACVYAVTAILKSGPRWREEGSALYFSLGARDLSTGIGDWIFHTVPEIILTIGTYGTLLAEHAIPMLLLLPIRSGWPRTVGALLIISLHLGIATTMTVGLFPAISIAGVIGILPKPFWNFAEARMPRMSFINKPGSVLRGLKDRLRSLNPQAQMPEQFSPRLRQSPESIQSQGNQVIHFVHTTSIPRANLKTVLINTIAAFSILLVLGLNVQKVTAYTLPQPVRSLSISTGLYQSWGMFAPGPQMSTIWFVAEGELQSGEKLDVMLPVYNDDLSIRMPVIWDQSDELVLQDKYWRKYFSAIRDRDTQLRRYLLFTCRSWNAEHTGEDRLVSVTLSRGISRTLPDGERDKPVYDQLGSWGCL